MDKHHCQAIPHQCRWYKGKCIRIYLEAVAGFPSVGDQLIRWLCTAKKPALMLMHMFMWR